MATHVMPIDDLREHSEEYCWCNPRIENCWDDSVVVIHNSADGRELLERSSVAGCPSQGVTGKPS